MDTLTDKEALKSLLKEALAELLTEQRGVISDIVAEALEDVGLVAAIDEGRESDLVGRDVVLNILTSSDSEQIKFKMR